MELLSVRLRNVRSFEDVAVPLGPGVVRIAGENGAGKSTILAAVAYAVLGPESVPSRKYALEKGSLELDHASKLLRRGAPWGSVEVVFRLASAPGRRFRIHRVLGERPRPRRPRGQSATPDPLETEEAALVELAPDGSVLARLDTGKKTITPALAKLLDLAPEAFAHGFQRIVAAPQGRLLQAITEDSKARREIYWKVLGVDRYGSAREDASAVGSALADRYLAPLKQAVAEAARAVHEVEDAPAKVESGVVAVADATERRDRARARRAQAQGERERALEALGRARERHAEGERLARELSQLLTQRLEAEAAVRAGEAAEKRRSELAPARALHAELRAAEGELEALRLEHARLAAAVEEARRRESMLSARDAGERSRVTARLQEETARLAALEQRAAGQRRERAELEARGSAQDEQVRAATVRARSLGRWCERALPSLASLATVARDLETGPGLERIARAAPPLADAPEDLALLERAREIEDRVARATEDAGAARALLESWAELEGKVGENGTCPFLLEPCPHERGRNLAQVVRESVARERARLAASEEALARAAAELARVRAARERLEKAREAREAWAARIARAAPPCDAAVRAFDRERAALAASIDPADLFFVPPPEARATLDLLARACASVPALPPSPAPGTSPSSEPPAWTPDSVAALARAARLRLEAVRSLPASLATELERARGVAEREASAAERRRAELTRELDRVTALLDRAPAEIAELARGREALERERAGLEARHAAEAAARTSELQALAAALAAKAGVPGRIEAWRAALERARRDDEEHARLEVVVAGVVAARERAQALGTAGLALAARAHELAAAAMADSLVALAPEGGAGVPADATGWLEPGALDRLVRTLGEVASAARRRGEEARRAEESSERELLGAESALGVQHDRLVEAMRRRDELALRQSRLARLRAAADHVAHACAVLRGTSGEGPLATSVFKALGDLPSRLAERRVRHVAGHARRIYRALAPHETWDLTWDPRTYVLALAPAGTDPSAAVREGIAVDDMSGGQQMSAALALHLALVHTYARNCDLLFLDEPTTNLDVKRRAALAECLRTLRSRVEGLIPLRQVLVVSHDEAFDALEDHTIVVERGASGGPSHVHVARAPVLEARPVHAGAAGAPV